MKQYIEHNGHKVVLSIAIEHRGKGFHSTMYVGQATDINTLIDKLDKAKLEYSNLLQKGALLVVDVQDYTSPEDAEDLFFNHRRIQ